MRAWLAGIATEDAVAAVVSAKIGQRQEHFPRVGDEAGFEVIPGFPGGGQQRGEILVMATDQAQSLVARDGRARAKVTQFCRAAGGLFRSGRADFSQSHSSILAPSVSSNHTLAASRPTRNQRYGRDNVSSRAEKSAGRHEPESD